MYFEMFAFFFFFSILDNCSWCLYLWNENWYMVNSFSGSILDFRNCKVSFYFLFFFPFFLFKIRVCICRSDGAAFERNNIIYFVGGYAQVRHKKKKKKNSQFINKISIEQNRIILLSMILFIWIWALQPLDGNLEEFQLSHMIGLPFWCFDIFLFLPLSLSFFRQRWLVRCWNGKHNLCCWWIQHFQFLFCFGGFGSIYIWYEKKLNKIIMINSIFFRLDAL